MSSTSVSPVPDFFLQLEVEGEPLAAFEAGLVAGFGSVQVGRYMIVPHILAYGYSEPFRTCGEVLRCYFQSALAPPSLLRITLPSTRS